MSLRMKRSEVRQSNHTNNSSQEKHKPARHAPPLTSDLEKATLNQFTKNLAVPKMVLLMVETVCSMVYSPVAQLSGILNC